MEGGVTFRTKLKLTRPAVCVCSGASPYPGIAAEQLCHMLKSGYRMDKPTTCSDQLYVQHSSHPPPLKFILLSVCL